MSTGLITITGEDIIGGDGRDNTSALAELGVAFTPLEQGYDTDIAAMRFQVDLSFVLRHGLLDERISKAYYVGTPEYLRYYNEGRDAFLAGQPMENPHDTGTVADPGYWAQSMYHKRYPWFDGYRQTEKATYTARYRLNEMQDRIRAIVAEHGCKVDYTDEYGTPYAVTPEGFHVELV